MKEPETIATTFSFHQGQAPPILPHSLMPDNQHNPNSLSNADLSSALQQVNTSMGSFANIGFHHDVFAHLDDMNAMAVPSQGRRHIQSHHVSSLPEMPQSHHDLSEPFSQNTCLGQQPSMKGPDYSATQFSFNPGQAQPLLHPNLLNGLSDAAIFPYLPKASTTMSPDVNAGLHHDVFAPSRGSDLLLSPSLLARGLQQQQPQHHKPSHIPRLHVISTTSTRPRRAATTE